MLACGSEVRLSRRRIIFTWDLISVRELSCVSGQRGLERIEGGIRTSSLSTDVHSMRPGNTY